MQNNFVHPKLALTVLFFLFVNSFSYSQDDSVQIKEANFTFPHVLNRLLSIPNSKIMNSLDLSLLLGGSFGFEENSGILGTAGLGLGGYGDLEIGSESLIGSMFNSTESFTNIGLKIKILSESENVPALAVGIKANNDWNSSNNDEEFIRTSESSLYDEGLRTANYDSRISTIYTAIGKTFDSGINFQAGLSYSDLRYKNVYIVFNSGNSTYSESEQVKENVFNYFGGFEYPLNNRTSILFEIQSYPYLKVSTFDGTISSDRRIVGAAGLRFFISRWLLLDSGIRYRDDSSGLAEAEIRLGLNGIWNLGF